MSTERSLLMRITPALMLALCLPLAAQEQRSPLANPNEFRPGVLRTPAERFENLQGYPFESNYMEVRVAAIPDRFARLVLMNTALPTGYGMMTENWYAVRNRFRLQANSGGVRQFAIGGITDPEIIRAYTAPFPDPSYYAGINVFPQLVPILPDDPMAPTMLRTAEFLTTWYRPALVMFSDGDQVLGPHQHWLRRLIPSAMDEPVITIEGAGHFLQENKGEEVAEHILEFFERHPLD